MQLVKAGELLAPNLCFICESFPQEGTQLVDTFRNHELGNHFIPLSGRKYICEHCALEIASEFGFISNEGAYTARYEKQVLEDALRGIRNRLNTLAEEINKSVNEPLSNLVTEGHQQMVLETPVKRGPGRPKKVQV